MELELFKVKILCTVGLVLDVGLNRPSSSDVVSHVESKYVDLRVGSVNKGTLRSRSRKTVDLL